MLNSKKKKANLEKKKARRTAFLKHRRRNPKDTASYRAFKKMREETIATMQKESEKRAIEDKKFGNKIKKFFDKFVPKIKPRNNYQRGK